MPYIPHIRSTTDSRSLESREALDVVSLSEPQDEAVDGLQDRDTIPSLHDTLASISDRSTQDDLKTLEARQTYILPIPETYQFGGPSPGTVVGIVLGSIAGFLLIIYLLWAVSNGGSLIRTTGDIEEIDIRRTSDRRSKRARSARSEMSRAEPRRDRVYRTERIIRDVPIRSRSSSPRSRIRDSSRIRETTIVEESRGERRVDGDDIVEVIEEHSELEPPRRKSGRRSSGYERSRY